MCSMHKCWRQHMLPRTGRYKQADSTSLMLWPCNHWTSAAAVSITTLAVGLLAGRLACSLLQDLQQSCALVEGIDTQQQPQHCVQAIKA